MNKFALIGIAGALAMAVSDVILLGQPVSGSYYDLSSFGAMEQATSLRAAVGSLLGLVSAFFICFGFWYLQIVFEPVNRKKAFLLFVSLSSMLFFAGAFHAGYYFLAEPENIGTLVLLPSVRKEFIKHLELISYLAVPGFVLGSILFFSLSLNKRFPVWFRYCNPLILTGVFLGLLYFLPAPVGGYIRPTFVNLATATLFIIALLVKKRST